MRVSATGYSGTRTEGYLARRHDAEQAQALSWLVSVGGRNDVGHAIPRSKVLGKESLARLAGSREVGRVDPAVIKVPIYWFLGLPFFLLLSCVGLSLFKV